MALCTVSGHLLLSKLSQRIQVSQLHLSLFNYLFFSFLILNLFNEEKHKLSGILMDGMVPTITWKKTSLVYGALRSLMLMETQLYLTIQEWSLGSNIAMDFGLIASPLGLNMPLSILPDLPHPTTVSTGIHHFQKGPIIYICRMSVECLLNCHLQ